MGIYGRGELGNRIRKAEFEHFAGHWTAPPAEPGGAARGGVAVIPPWAGGHHHLILLPDGCCVATGLLASEPTVGAWQPLNAETLAVYMLDGRDWTLLVRDDRILLPMDGGFVAFRRQGAG